MTLRRVHLVALASLLAAGAGIALHGAAQPAAPGSFVSWSGAASPAPSGAPLASLLPVPAPSSPPDGGLLGGLQVPLGSMLQGLNQETAASASGQYSILQELQAALRDRIASFLTWVESRH